MSSEFQILFTAILTLLAGLALFILRSVFKKFETFEATLSTLQTTCNDYSTRLTALETINKIKIIQSQKYRGPGPGGYNGDED